MASNAINARWGALVQWTLGQQDLPVSKCIQDVETLSQWTNGTDVASWVWQCYSRATSSEVPLNSAADKFAEFKRKLLVYLEEAPRGDSFTVEQLRGIQKQIDANATLVEMWNCTKKNYFIQARSNRVTREFPDYVFGFTSSGTLAERVIKIKDQIQVLNRRTSLGLRTATEWVLRNTNLTHAFVPEIITSHFTHIRFLDMSYNQFSTLGDLSHLEQLEMLWLTGNRLREIVEAHLPVSLEELDLDRNQLEEVSDLTRLTRLTSLDVSTNRLDEISSRNLPDSLRRLDVRNNRLDSIDDIQEAFQDLEIEFDSEAETSVFESTPIGESDHEVASDSEEEPVVQPTKRRKRRK
jgi:hypothetical protein